MPLGPSPPPRSAARSLLRTDSDATEQGHPPPEGWVGARHALALPALLGLSVALGPSCGIVEEAYSYPVMGSISGSVQVDASALKPQPIPADCGQSLSDADRTTLL